jgi:hypothetical protein
VQATLVARRGKARARRTRRRRGRSGDAGGQAGRARRGTDRRLTKRSHGLRAGNRRPAREFN